MTVPPPRSPSRRARLVAELADTLDVMVEQPLVGVALFGDERPAIGRYTIERRLGAGATAVVYAARDTTLDRPVALKIVAGCDADGAWLARAHGEARALARLSHPNVVAVHDVGEWRGHPFIAMELVDGVTLARWQAERRAWPEILRCYLAAGRGLEAAHSVGLVHRDFKPANVLVTDSGRVVVTDFGLATHIDPDPKRMAAGSQPRVGTPAYLAPEQCNGEAPQPSADVYSFAVALCEALAGWHPALEPARDWRLQLRRAGLPEHACAAIARGMADEPERRWSHMGPLLAALEAALPARPARRGLGVAGVAIGLGIAAAAAFVGSRLGKAPKLGAQVAIARRLLDANPTPAAALLREVPMDQRDEDWRAMARATLLRPLARELRCLEGRARTEPSIRHGLLAAVDQGGHAIVCDLAAEQVTSLIPDAVCARALDRDRVGVVTAAGELAIFARSDGWQLRRRIAIGRISPDVPVSDASCDRDIMIVGPHALALRSGAAAWQLVDLASFASMDLVDTGDAGRRPLAISADRRSVLVVSSGSVVEAPVGGSVDPGAPVLARSRYVARDPTDVVAVVARDGEAAVIDVQRRQVIRRDRLALDSYVSGFERTPDGRMAVAATVRGTLVWWPLSGEPGAPWLEAVSESVLMQIAFNRSGTRLVWRDDLGAVGVRDVGRASGHELVSGGGSICDVGFATDDRVVAMSCDGRTLAWDLTEERTYVAGRHDLAHCRPECSAEATAIWSAAVDRSGSVLATAGSDGTVGIWPLRRDERGFVARRLSIGTASRAFAAVFFGDRLFVGPHDSAAQLWDWRAGTRLVDLPGHETWVYTAALARPAGEPATLVTGAKSGTLRFWSEDGLVLRAVTKVSAVASTRVNDLAVSPSGRLVAAALDTGEVAVCDAATGAIILRKAVHRDWARRVLFLDEETVLSAGDDGLVQQIAVRSGAITSIRAHDRPIYDVDRHGSSLLTASVDGTVRLWDLRDGSRVRTYVGHEGFVGVVRWHPDGTRFVTGSRDGRACVWQIEQDTCHDWLIGHHGEVRAAQFIDGDRVVTAAKDGTARVWTPVLVEATVEDLSEELDRRAPACLDEQQRRSYLDESASDASARTRACRSAAR